MELCGDLIERVYEHLNGATKDNDDADNTKTSSNVTNNANNSNDAGKEQSRYVING